MEEGPSRFNGCSHPDFVLGSVVPVTPGQHGPELVDLYQRTVGQPAEEQPPGGGLTDTGRSPNEAESSANTAGP